MVGLALVTGAAHRLGKTFALTLARLGYDLVLHYNAAEKEAQETQAEIEALGRNVKLVQADLSDFDKVQSLISNIGPLSVLVNSAAIMKPGTVQTMSVEDWDLPMDLNVRAPFLLAQAAARSMQPGGLIVNISDVGAQKAWSRYPSYTVSKAALESLTQVLARALAPNIRVNAIAPGFVLQSNVVDAETWDRLVKRVPLQRPARVEEIGSALEFLIKNEYMTGQVLVVDGGYSLL